MTIHQDPIWKITMEDCPSAHGHIALDDRVVEMWYGRKLYQALCLDCGTTFLAADRANPKGETYEAEEPDGWTFKRGNRNEQ